MRYPAECIHLENGHPWMATFIPDTLYLRGKPRLAANPCGRKFRSVSIAWRACWSRSWLLTRAVWSRLNRMARRFTQYFFLGKEDFAAAGLRSKSRLRS